jgi:hypothetical protein
MAVAPYTDSVFGLPCQVGKGQSGSIAAVINKRKIPGGPNVFLDIAGLDQPEGTWPVLVENQATASQFYAVVGTEGDLVCAQGTYRILLESVEGGDAWMDSPRVLTLKAYILAWSGVAPPSDADTTQLIDFAWGNGEDYLVTFYPTATIDTVEWFWSDGQQTTQTGPFADPAALPTVEHTFDVDDPAVGTGRWVVYVSVTAGGVTSSRASDLVTVTGA